jgi:hypothetical protein
MYPEYRKKLKQMVIPHAKVFENAVMKAQK